jgi:hypothetical protein
MSRQSYRPAVSGAPRVKVMVEKFRLKLSKPSILSKVSEQHVDASVHANGQD